MRDPPAVEGDEAERRAAFAEAARALAGRMERLAALPLEELDRRDLEEKAARIAE